MSMSKEHLLLTKNDLLPIFHKAEELYGFSSTLKPINEALYDYLMLVYDEELYMLEGDAKIELVNDIANIIYIANYEYRTNEAIINDDIYDGHQSLDELKKLGNNNTKKNFLDLLYKMRNQEATNDSEIFHDILLNPPGDVTIVDITKESENIDPQYKRAIGGNKMNKATDVATMKEYFGEMLKNKHNNYPLIISEKLDGSSLYLTYDSNGTLIRAEQRGSDEVDTTLPLSKVLKIQGVKSQLDVSKLNLKSFETIEIRGEMLVKRDEFAKINEQRVLNNETKYSNTRNAGAGFIADDSEKNVGALSFLGFEIYRIGDRTLDNIPTKRVEQDIKIDFFDKNGIEKPRLYFVNTIEEFMEIYNKYELEDILMTSNYAMDGLIVTENTDVIELTNTGEVTHSFAAKFSPTTELLKMIKYEVTIGKDGRVSLVANFEPKDVGGVIVENSKLDSIYSQNPVTFLQLFNEGDEVLIGRMGDVIPKVMYNQKFRPLVKSVLHNTQEFFKFVLNTNQQLMYPIEKKELLNKAIEISHLANQTKVTSENKAYLLKYATEIAENYMAFSKKFSGDQLMQILVDFAVNSIMSEKELKEAKIKFSKNAVHYYVEDNAPHFDFNAHMDMNQGYAFPTICPMCGSPLQGIEEGNKLIVCKNSECVGIKKAELMGFVEALSTKLDSKPKITKEQFIDYIITNNLVTMNINDITFFLKDFPKISRSMINLLNSKKAFNNDISYFNALNQVYQDKVISDKTLDFLYDHNIIKNFEDLLSLNETSFIDPTTNSYYAGFGKGKVNNILLHIKNMQKNNSDFNFIAALNIPNFATSNSKLLFEKISLKDILAMDFPTSLTVDTMKEHPLYIKMIGIKGIGEVMAYSLVSYLIQNKTKVVNLLNNFDFVLDYTKVVDTSNVIPAKVVVTESLQPGKIEGVEGIIEWKDRKTFEANLNKQLVSINGIIHQINITSKVGSKIDSSKIEMIISDSANAKKGVEYAKNGGIYWTTNDFVNFCNGELDFFEQLQNNVINNSNAPSKKPQP